MTTTISDNRYMYVNIKFNFKGTFINIVYVVNKNQMK
jgi:hypothetical protein